MLSANVFTCLEMDDTRASECAMLVDHLKGVCPLFPTACQCPPFSYSLTLCLSLTLSHPTHTLSHTPHTLSHTPPPHTHTLSLTPLSLSLNLSCSLSLILVRSTSPSLPPSPLPY